MSTLDLEPDDSPRPARQLWETELEEILAASDRDPTTVEKARSKVVSARYQTPDKAGSLFDRLRAKWSSGMWMLVFLGLVILTFAVRHYSPLLGRVFAIAAIVLLLVIIGKALFRPSAAAEPPSQMWRGRDMSGISSSKSRLSQWFGKRDNSWAAANAYSAGSTRGRAGISSRFVSNLMSDPRYPDNHAVPDIAFPPAG